MDNPGTAINPAPVPPAIRPLSASDLQLIQQVREELVQRGINPPSWRESDTEKRRSFFDAVREILIHQNGTSNPPGNPSDDSHRDVNHCAQIITDALSGIGLLNQLLRDPYVEEIFVRNGQVAVEYDGCFHLLGKLADDSYFENLAIHIADQGGAALRGDRPAVLVDLPGGERFTAILPRLSTKGTAINIRTFGRRVRTLEEMAQSGTFTNTAVPAHSVPQPKNIAGTNRIQSLPQQPERFLAWLACSLSGSLMIAGEMGSGKTTLLNALSGFLPVSAPVAALETFRELEIQHPFLLRTVAPAELPAGTPGVTLDWVLNIIYTRMNPAAILVGEVVGKEALQFLKAACLGRKAFTTIHGGSIEESLMRLEQLTLAAAPELGLAAVRAMVAMGLDAVALMGRVRFGDKVERTLLAIAILQGLDANGNYQLKYLYKAGDESKRCFLESVYQQMEVQQ